MAWKILTVAIFGIAALLIYKVLTYWQKRKFPTLDFKTFTILTFKGLFKKLSIAESVHFFYNYSDDRYLGLYSISQPVLMVKDLELIKKITVKDFDSFINHKVIITEEIDPMFGKNLVSLQGQRWKNMRSTLSPAFTSSKMKGMYVFMSECAEQFTDYFLKEIESGKGTLSLEMKDLFARYTNDIIATCAFGIKCDSLKDKNNEFYETGQKCINFGSFALLKFMAYAMAPRLMKALNIRLLGQEVYEFFTSMVTETVRTREREGIIRPDMIHLLMEAKKGKLKHDGSQSNNIPETGAEDSNIELTDMDITAQAVIFFIAGFDTSSTMMSFMSHELAVNPDIQKKLQDEIDDAMKECNGKITYDALMRMKYLDMVTSETLRKWPVAALTERNCERDYVIDEVNGEKLILEKGISVWFPVYGLQRDPKYFPEPERFDPERFSDENKSNIVPFTYMPFGMGPRSCIGNRFALLEVKTLFVHLLSKFDIVVVEKTKVPLKLDRTKFNMSAEGGFWLGLKRR